MNRPEWLPEKLDIKLYNSWMKYLEDAYPEKFTTKAQRTQRYTKVSILFK